MQTTLRTKDVCLFFSRQKNSCDLAFIIYRVVLFY